MKHETLAGAGLRYTPCQYGMSRLVFRGPARDITDQYIAFVGGTETFGRFVETPFPALIEQRLDEICVNLGCINASIDAFINEPAVATICHDALLNVVQIMGAQNLSNRFYKVHPRRNDRFLRASAMLRVIYPEVDFAEHCFTRHMLTALKAADDERFSIIVAELRKAWLARMKLFLRDIGPRTLLLWCAVEQPADDEAGFVNLPQSGPLFVTRAMLDELRPLVRGLVIVPFPEDVLAAGTRGMVLGAGDTLAATALPGPGAHAVIADYVTDAIRLALKAPGAV